MNYNKIFDPSLTSKFEQKTNAVHSGDRRDGLIYVYSDEKIILAVNVAIVTGRPLLVRGPSGCGKSTLAQNVAHVLEWEYFEQVITSRTQAQDLLWRLDALRRLNDAQANQLRPGYSAYIEAGVIWKAFAAISDSESHDNQSTSTHKRAVILLDEIDKADPDVPNNLLVPLGSLQFMVPDLEIVVKSSRPPLVFITTNNERELPTAFLRRCVVLELNSPNEDQMVKIARAHFGLEREENKNLYRAVAKLLFDTYGGDRSGTQSTPSTAEYLDTVRACIKLGIDPRTDAAENTTNDVWKALSQIVLWKSTNSLR